MGNRAVIALNEFSPDALGIYLHWNGGRDSIEGFLEAAKRITRNDQSYGAARLVQVITTFFAGGLSVGLDLQKNLDCDNYDNGVYVVDTSTFEIIGREFRRNSEQAEYDVQEFADEVTCKIEAANAATTDEDDD